MPNCMPKKDSILFEYFVTQRKLEFDLIEQFYGTITFGNSAQNQK